jgi:hypothetical protein
MSVNQPCMREYADVANYVCDIRIVDQAEDTGVRGTWRHEDVASVYYLDLLITA